MKSKSFVAAFLLLFSSLFFTSCTQSVDDYPDASALLTRGNWTADYYFSGTNRSAQPAAYAFTFHTDGTLSVGYNGTAYAGSWKIARNVQGEVLQLQVQSQVADVADLNTGWTIAAASGQNMSLSTGASQLRMERR